MRTVPSSTYRLQLSADFTFDDARALLPYLVDLGIGWIYLSPVLQSTPGSNHGYDVVDPSRVDTDRGGQEAFDELCRSAHQHGLGVLVDIVPNHVGVGEPAINPWWWDLLTHGRDSRYATAFDIDWAAGDGKVVLPVLGDDQTPEDHRGRHPDSEHFALRPWREEASGLNYRRFFAVSSLAAVRVEDHDVFEASHAQVRRWFASGLVDGLRVDHPDGLRHPRGYLVDLADVTSGSYTLVEKILEPGEDLPRGWHVDGTTGYEVLGQIDRVLVDADGAAKLAALDHELRGDQGDWAELLYRSKLEVATSILDSEVRRIAREVGRSLPDLDADRVRDCLAELLAAFPVYRSYLPDGAEHLDEAVERVTGRRPDLGDVLAPLGALLHDPTEPAALRFQQTSGMVMAKGAEDRAFYRWSPLTSLDEVGGDPATTSVSVESFHAAMRERQLVWPDAMTTLSTHDTKRGEDVRARINVLSELPDWWTATLAALQERAPLPDPGLANLLWQAVLGCWPASEERIQAYAEKAMREASERTTWTDPDTTFEQAVHAAVATAYSEEKTRALLDEAAATLAPYGWSNGLAAKLLSLTVPGVPDVYQGSELWEQSLVDPDNRRPVDFERRRALLDEPGPERGRPTTLDDDGAAKLHLVRTVLRLRRDRPELFTDYRPLEATGAAAEHVLAFDRGGAITVVSRLPLSLESGGGWGDTRLALPPGPHRDLLTDRVVTDELADVLGVLGVALLVRDDR